MLPAYRAFALKAFGPATYQSRAEYLRWLYEESPHGRGISDALVAVNGDAVVGCIHKMRMGWRFGEASHVMPSLHNTMVLPEHREGVGGLLLAKSLRGEPRAFVPGAVGAVADVLRRLGFREAGAHWRVGVIRPMAFVGRLAVRATRLPVACTGMRCFAMLAESDQLRRDLLTSVGLVDDILALMRPTSGDASACSVEWDRQAFRWRFLHEIGPRHLFVLHKTSGRIDGVAILTVGDKDGIAVGRIVDWRAGSEHVLQGLVRQSTRVFSQVGAHVVIIGGGGEANGRKLANLGWGRARSRPESFIKFPAENQPCEVVFQPSVGDYGLETLSLNQ